MILISKLASDKKVGRVIGLRTILASFVKISSALLTGILITRMGVNNTLLLFSILILASFITIGNMKKNKYIKMKGNTSSRLIRCIVIGCK